MRRPVQLYHVYRIIGLWLCCTFSPFVLQAQDNLVPNGSFEPAGKQHPSKNINREGAPFKPLVDGWYTPTSGTSDYYNSDRSTFLKGQPVKKARTGQGRMGIIANAKSWTQPEYVQARLTAPLKKDALYCVTLYTSLDKRCDYYAEHIGVCFTDTTLTGKGSPSLFKMVPDENIVLCGKGEQNAAKTGWVEHKQVYRAQGGERYITIGNFDAAFALAVNDDDPVHHPVKGHGIFGPLAYYYVDDVSVEEITPQKMCRPSADGTPPLNHFVFLADVSASMAKAGYLNQLGNTLTHLMDTLGANDLVSLLTFDLRTRVLLRAVPAHQRNTITGALQKMQAGSVTNIDRAITTAYRLMDSVLIAGGNNRVILISDAQFTLSDVSRSTIRQMHKKKNICFSMIQFGYHYNKTLEKAAAKTKGVYTSAQNDDPLRALSTQVKKAGEDEYTPSTARKGKTEERLLMRVLGE